MNVSGFVCTDGTNVNSAAADHPSPSQPGVYFHVVSWQLQSDPS